MRYFAASLLLHAALIVGLSFAFSSPLRAKLDITWLDFDNRLGAPRPVAVPKKREPKPAAKPSVAKPAKAKPAKAKRAKLERAKKKVKAAPKKRKRKRVVKRFTTRKVALTRMAPGDAALMLLLRMDRIRRSPYAKAVRRLLSVFYDYRTLLWSRDLDVVRDFDAMLIATPNPYRVTRTFLAIRHKLPPARLRAAFERSVRVGSGAMRWSRKGGELVGTIPAPPRLRNDRRRLFVRDGLAMLALDRQRSFLDARPRNEKGTRTALERLRELDHAGGAAKDRGLKPGLLLQAINLPRLIRLPPGIPLPSNVQVTVPARAPAVVRGVLTFARAANARAFIAAVRPRIQRARGSLLLRLMGIGSMLDRLALKARGKRVSARIRLSGEEVKQLLDLFRSAIPRVYVQGMKQRRGAQRGQSPRLKSVLRKLSPLSPTTKKPRVPPADKAKTRSGSGTVSGGSGSGSGSGAGGGGGAAGGKPDKRTKPAPKPAPTPPKPRPAPPAPPPVG